MTPPRAGAAASPPTVTADHFDGRQARAYPVRLTVEGGWLLLQPLPGTAAAPGADAGPPAEDDPARGPGRYALDQLEWPDRQHRAGRLLHLPDGGSLQAHDAAAFDAFAEATGGRASWISRLQQSWRATLVAGALLLALGLAGYRWGLPWAADAGAAMVPAGLEASLDDAVLEGAIGRWLKPSQLPMAQQAAIRQAFDAMLARGYADGERPRCSLRFHAGSLGPNAFALPGGTIVLSDELVQRVDGDLPMLLGVLAHEAGHVRHRHGTRLLLRTALLGSATALAFGDFSGLLASAPALLGQLAYTRDFEREADAESVRLLRASGHSPAVMADFFERLREPREHDGDVGFLPGIALSSHPPDAERMRSFRAAADADGGPAPPAGLPPRP